MPFPYIALSFFQVSCKKPNGIKKNILTLKGGGGAQSNEFGLVLLCNSGKTVLAKTFGVTFCVCWLQLQINVSTKNEGNDQNEMCLFPTNI